MVETPEPSSRESQADEQNRVLYEKYDNLEKDWFSIKRSIQRPNCHHSSIATADPDHAGHLQFLNHSPRELMSCLQNGMAPSPFSPAPGKDEFVHIAMKSDAASVETVRDREAGKLLLKGRRLFEEEGESESEDLRSECLDLVQGSNSEVSSVCASNASAHPGEDVVCVDNGGSHSDTPLCFCRHHHFSCCLASSISHDRVVVEETERKEVEKNGGDGGVAGGKHHGRRSLRMALLSGVLVLVLLGIILSNYNGGDKAAIVPT